MKRYIRSATSSADEARAKKSKNPEELAELYTQYFSTTGIQFPSTEYWVLCEVAANPYTPSDILESLYFDTDRPLFNTRIASNPSCPESVMEDIMEKGNSIDLGRLARNKNCPFLQDLFEDGMRSDDTWILVGLTSNPSASPEMLDALANYALDPSRYKDVSLTYGIIKGLNKNRKFRKTHDLLPLPQ